jgi:hypothetical protein
MLESADLMQFLNMSILGLTGIIMTGIIVLYKMYKRK